MLLPVDAAGRVLELLLVLHSHWSSQKLYTSYTLAFASPQAHNTIDFAKSQLDFMTNTCRKILDIGKVNPFSFQHLKLCTTQEEIDALPRPYCLLSSNTSLESSLSQHAFLSLSMDSLNLLLLTSRAPEWSNAGQFFDFSHGRPNHLKPEFERSSAQAAIATVSQANINYVKLNRKQQIKLVNTETEQSKANKTMEG